ncbi:hypothetical protein JCGZ_26238 [Jatropha curcas]|uniref:Pectinesterase inhibitor domain-containing protein n=2 Tax=Jatropha curcas TaxID=180498 RepID=A0A067JEZ6_JATCU|nr:hypothetical protein JCGZ_26238 [Jatropha curcas]
METKTISPCSINLLITFLLSCLLLISNIQSSVAATPVTTTKTSKTVYKNYLKTACNTTTYPKLCYNSLSPYTSTIKTNDLSLCNTALTITVKVAKNTSGLIKELSKRKGLSKSEAAVIKDCKDEISDSIDELKQAIKALASLKSSNSTAYVIDDIKTYVSAAITNDYTCLDGFEGMKVSASLQSKIKKSVTNFASLTSNALALINKLEY